MQYTVPAGSIPVRDQTGRVGMIYRRQVVIETQHAGGSASRKFGGVLFVYGGREITVDDETASEFSTSKGETLTRISFIELAAGM